LWPEPREIVGRHALAKIQRGRTANLDFPHVADVKESRTLTNRPMLVDDTAILNWHLPTGELHHFRTRAPMHGIERSSLHSVRHGDYKPTPFDLLFALQGIFGCL
jgi:hypothetical protein